MTHPVVWAFIFARGGSKGIPRKNLRLLGGKPLLAHSIECAHAVALVQRVIVSTDDAEIAAVAREYGAEVPFIRPPELATDTSSEWAAWQHALRTLGCDKPGSPPDVFLSLPATAPLRLPSDVDRCVAALLESKADIVITGKKAARHPSFNMVTLDAEGYASLAMPPAAQLVRRQDAPPLFDLTTVAYAALPNFVLQGKGVLSGRARLVEIPEERAVDIDTELDFDFADFLYKRRR